MDIQALSKADVAAVGGKAANLGELMKIPGIRVPQGFCIPTSAFRAAEVPDALLANVKDDVAYAVRSSATAEDSPTASFAGQQDTFLNVRGKEAVRQAIAKCWASLNTPRAIAYREQQGIDAAQVAMAVVVQEMVFPEVAGVMFTADPVSGNRKVVTIDASFGLGEALVSGLVNADGYKVRDGAIVEKNVATKQLAILPVASGGTQERPLAPDQQQAQALTDAQILELAALGRRIEAHFGAPQDIEWCLADGQFYMVQSRPITTLFPVPQAADDENHVYVSVGHQQMMTDAMKPLGLSFWQLLARRPMFEAGSRLFVDVTQLLASPATQAMILKGMGEHDPLIGDALANLVERPGFLKDPNLPKPPAFLPKGQPELPPSTVDDLISVIQASLAKTAAELQTKHGDDLFAFLLDDLKEEQRLMADPRSGGVFMAAIEASAWINDHIAEWLGEKGVADHLTQSVPHNVTSEMGLALMEVADAMRPHPEVVAYLQHPSGPLEDLLALPGGREFQAFLAKYGMRCPGEIDITRARWAEDPTALFPLLLGNIQHFAPGAGRRKFEEGLQAAQAKEADLLARLRELPDGEAKAAETKAKIDVLRNFIGYREYPKYAIVSRFFLYKQALKRELGDLSAYEYLTFDELRLVARRKAAYQLHARLTPPRVITSEGEVVTGSYRREGLPPGALVGLAVSAGVVEGRARVVLDLHQANLEPGDILVTKFTDPSWTPLFVAIKGLVTEVGGLMTHGAVIAREYGLPAVVGVNDATRRIRDGQRIRVHGTEGYVELLG